MEKLLEWSVELKRLATCVGDDGVGSMSVKDISESCWSDDYESGLSAKDALIENYRAGRRPELAELLISIEW